MATLDVYSFDPMKAIQSRFASARFQRLLFWIGATALTAGVVTLVITLVPGRDTPNAAPAPGFKAVLPTPTTKLHTGSGKPVTRFADLDPEIKSTVRGFILTVVARKNLARSWHYVHPTMRAGYTLERWEKGNLPVIPFPVYKYDSRSYTSFALTEATSSEILADVGLSPRPHSGYSRARTFTIGLSRAGKGAKSRWLVDYWMPNYTAPVKMDPARQG